MFNRAGLSQSPNHILTVAEVSQMHSSEKFHLFQRKLLKIKDLAEAQASGIKLYGCSILNLGLRLGLELGLGFEQG